MKQGFDRLTGSITMYRLVLIALGSIAALSLILAAFGQLAFTPLEIIVTAVVAVGVTVSSSFLIALAFRARPHLESSLITGWILFFLFAPTLDAVQLAGLALAAAIASLSKYVLAVRGRHVLNPAAIGAVIVSLTGLNVAIWWVATPFLLPLVAIGAFLILYRTERLALGGVFIAIAAMIVVARIVTTGGDLAGAVATAFLSYPIVFLAGFMLSEPLTQPPRRWQQLLVAGIVGVLFAVPFSIGPLFSSPELALVVGNVVAFAFGQRRGIRLTYLGKRELVAGTWELSFQPARPVRFSPGQYVELTIPHRKSDFRGSRRYFTIASAPSESGPISIAITVPAKSSSFKQALLDLPEGATVRATQVGGDFVLPRDAAEPLLLVAGGIGITPFASQLAHATERGEQRDVTVVYSTSAAGEPAFHSLLEASGARVVLYSPEPPSPLPAGWVYGGAGRVTGERLAETVPDVAARRAFVSGPPGLVTELRRALRSQGVKRVHSDSFSGY